MEFKSSHPDITLMVFVIGVCWVVSILSLLFFFGVSTPSSSKYLLPSYSPPPKPNPPHSVHSYFPPPPRCSLDSLLPNNNKRLILKSLISSTLQRNCHQHILLKFNSVIIGIPSCGSTGNSLSQGTHSLVIIFQ